MPPLRGPETGKLAVSGRPRCAPLHLPQISEATTLPSILTYHLACRLAENDIEKHDNAAAALTRMGVVRDLDPTWLAYKLRHRDADVRARAAETLGAMGRGADHQASVLAECLADHSECVWHAAGKALRQVGESGLNALAEQLQNPSSEVRGRAAQALRWAGADATRFVDALAGLMEESETEPWRHAADTLVCLGDVSIAALKTRLWHEHDFVLRRAADTLRRLGVSGANVLAKRAIHQSEASSDFMPVWRSMGQTGDVGVAYYCRWLAHQDPKLQMEAVTALGQMCDDDAAIVRQLVPLLVHWRPEVREHTFTTLVGSGVLAAAELADEFRDVKDPALRCVLSEVFGRMSHTTELHANVLIDVLFELDCTVCRNAGDALVRMGSHAAAALSTRLMKLERAQALARMRMEEILSRMGDDGAAALAPVLNGSTPHVRIHAARALGRMAKFAVPHVDAIVETFRVDPDPSVRRVCAEALLRLDGPGVSALRKCLADRDPNIRLLAAETLEQTPVLSRAPG